MKPYLWAVLCLGSLFVLYFTWSPSTTAPPPRAAGKTVKHQSLATGKTESSPKTRKNTKATVANLAPHTTPPEAIEFEVDGELAIAHGDIILGTVEPGDNIDSGFYKPFRPRLWESNEIPFHIDDKLPNPERVQAALDQLESQTSLKFIPFADQEDALVFVRGEAHCYSYLGRIGGHQPVQLSDNCTTPAILHEVMHALGFIHEHSRTDRDAYVKVNWENVEEKFRPQFEMVPEVLMDPIKGMPFDFDSIMLYPPSAFAKDAAKPTLSSLTGKALNPQNAALSPADVERVERLYR